MLRHPGGTRVKCGYYWNPRKWDLVMVPKEGGLLPGDPERRYVRVPILLVLLAAPVMGGLYVVFLPLIGFVLILRLTGRKTAEALQAALAAVLATLSPVWRPGEAYFAGKRGTRPPAEGPAAPTPEQEDRLERLEQEIESRRTGHE